MTAVTPPRPVFYISGGTGITAEALGQSLLSQFGRVAAEGVTLPYVTSEETAREAVARIRHAGEQSGCRPLVFSTLVDTGHRDILSASPALVLDLFAAFLGPLEHELGVASSHKPGQSHAIRDPAAYRIRIDAVHFALANDDGGRIRDYDDADIILLGVSRSSKTPTCLYLALQFGLRAANYPLTEEDLETRSLPADLSPFREKLFGLTINADRLAALRSERMSGSRYASPRQCDIETRAIQDLFEHQRIQSLDTTDLSIEEISTRILAHLGAR